MSFGLFISLFTEGTVKYPKLIRVILLVIDFWMPNPLFAIPLNMGTGTWIVTIVAGLGFVVMFGLASAGGDYQGLINTTLENDALAREKRKDKK